MFYLDKPFIYRIHEKPTPEKLENFYDFLRGLGINAKRRKDQIFSKDFQTVLKNADQTPVYTVINRVMLRSMQKAKYSPEEKGHFGLSKEHYCHFTSPIRRYPDLVVHRVIKDFLKGENVEEKYGDFVYCASEQSSKKERNAIEAERAVDEYYKMLYISEYVGEEFDGVVSSVTGWGFYVALPNGAEGLVHISQMDDYFEYDADRGRLIGTATGITFRLGDRVRVRAAQANIPLGEINFDLLPPAEADAGAEET
jgi:ribonuclease R